MTTEAQAPVKRGPGRPRDPEVERRMKRAALETLAEHGFSGLTLERICERAGAPRATFYRRWATPIEAVAEAFDDAFHFPELPDTGDVVKDLVILGQAILSLYGDPVMGPCMSFLMAESRVRPELVDRHRHDFPRRRAYNRSVVERAMARGEIAADIDPDLIIDVISGLALNNQATGRPVTVEMLEFVVRRLLNKPA
ncbi:MULTISPECIES: TetR/AcrR family transcriptional regulator [Caulobacter]|uniref:Transcriptional regulator, TetR family n=1 Tax=Caulobacter vibrioides OR37 TaxID=1292034 RepID=R0CVY9_CAUVI|nr:MULTISPECIES: TetR/AcrR family transcriptional regulator [Caulobacter]ENZ80666.1 transcriptional regulator, TetR family [Caulobacter vibrioides OR37]MBQ1560873.1 TetR/AcrR family transcriptional regulator [Caulobacter sp.]